MNDLGSWLVVTLTDYQITVTKSISLTAFNSPTNY